MSEHDIATVARHVPKPLCVNMGFGIRSRDHALIAPAQLQALGVAVVIYPRLLTACAIQGMQHGIAALRDAMQSPTVLERPELAVSFEELNALVGFAELQERERRYTTPHPEPRARLYRPAGRQTATRCGAASAKSGMMSRAKRRRLVRPRAPPPEPPPLSST